MNTTEPHAKGEHGEPPAGKPAPTPLDYIRKGLKALASLQLTVVLFSFAILLVFFGTLAQLDNGIWTVVDKYFWSTIVMVPLELVHKFLGVFWKEWFPTGDGEWPGSFPLPGGILLGALMLTNLLAAHATRFRLSWKRAGVFLIHGGLILLFVGEYITREYAIEQRMTIETGKSSNFTEDSRNVQLTFIDHSDPNADRVALIPQNMLREAKGRITHPDLPVDVELVGDYMPNASFPEPPKPGQTNPATAGLGLSAVVTKQKEVAGVDTEQRVDMPSVYVRLYKKGTSEEIGVYLTSLWLYRMGRSDEFTVDGKKYELTLRFKRYYKQYSIHLDKFRFDRYIGTGKAKNYSSDVKVYDQAGNLVREQRISMNDPLRYEGETFYQQSFDKSETTTILQVVRNPGWRLPYISCAVVGFGLLLHFGLYLVQFLSRSRTVQKAADAVATVGAMTSPYARHFPKFVLSVMAVYLVSIFGRMNPKPDPYDLDAFARIPVVDGGRTKPLDTVARVNLRVISGREEFEDENGKKQPAIRWYLETLSGGGREHGPVWKYRVFRIDNEQVLRQLELENREGLRYSLEEIGPKFDKIEASVRASDQKVAQGKKLDTTDMKFQELHKHLGVFLTLAQFGGGPEPNGPFLLLLPPPDGEETWGSLKKVRTAAMRESVITGMLAAQKQVTANERLFKLTEAEQRKLVKLWTGSDAEKIPDDKRVNILVDVVAALKADPRAIKDEARQEWLELAYALMTEADEKAIRALMREDYQNQLAKYPAAQSWDKMITAYRDKKPEEFNAAAREYRAKHAANVRDTNPPGNVFAALFYAPFNALGIVRTEVAFNRFAPFYQCTGLYVIGFVLSMIGFSMSVAQKSGWATALRRSGTYVLLLALLVHTVALFARMYVMDRPFVFVTNLYSSAVFIGWGCVALCLVLERIFPVGIGNTVAATLGLATCIVAHNLGTQDTLEMMEAVLDTNFWLATHVTTVTLGYTATFVAGFLGAIYVLRLLGTVIRDSYESKGEPTVGALLAFGTAVLGLVTVPIFFLWFMKEALAKFEVVHGDLLEGVFWMAAASAVVYALVLMLLRVTAEGVDAQGRPYQGQVPPLARPVVELALTAESSKVLGQMVYGVVAFATLLSFVGTVLGGIWADQSWGRFWGWDPKENGAVLIVLWNSLILHARWCGLVKDRGVAVLAVFGNAITAWSWFGTNQLGIGLHAYGFDSRLADGCFNFWVLQLALVGFGALIPRHFWLSATRRAVATSVPVTEVIGPTAASVPPTITPPAPTAPTGIPPVNGHTNGSPNGNGNGHPHRDKGKGKKDRKRR